LAQATALFHPFLQHLHCRLSIMAQKSRSLAALVIRRGHEVIYVHDQLLAQQYLHSGSSLDTAEDNKLSNLAKSALVMLAEHQGVHFSSLGQAMPTLRRQVSSGLYKELQRVNIAASVLRHFTQPWADCLLQRFKGELATSASPCSVLSAHPDDLVDGGASEVCAEAQPMQPVVSSENIFSVASAPADWRSLPQESWCKIHAKFRGGLTFEAGSPASTSRIESMMADLLPELVAVVESSGFSSPSHIAEWSSALHRTEVHLFYRGYGPREQHQKLQEVAQSIVMEEAARRGLPPFMWWASQQNPKAVAPF